MSLEISVIIPTLNAENRIGYLIERLQSQTLKPTEIIIIDSSSDDKTVEIAKSYDGVRTIIIDRPLFNHGRTRHDALMQTKTEYVCFMTDDAIPANSEFLSELVKPLSDPEVAMASGRQLPKADARRFEQLVRQFNYPSESNIRSKLDIPKYGLRTFFATDVCSIYRRTSYDDVGGFKMVDTNEDMLIAAMFIDKGYKIAYAANATVLHSHNLTAKQQYKRNRAVGFFLESHAEDLANASEVGHGARMVTMVSKQLLKEFNLMELCAFGIDCMARLIGNKIGRKEARLTKEYKYEDHI